MNKLIVRTLIALLRKLFVASLVLALTAAVSPQVQAQARGHAARGGSPVRAGAPTHMDGRFGHGHSYYDHGYAFRGAPRGSYDVHHGGEALSYDRSHWYRRDHGRSIIIGAPFGAFVPFLPWYYSTIWWDGIPYYYANDTYYTWNADQDQYEVIQPPAGIESAQPNPAPAIGDLYVYPKNGQTADQQARDESECHHSSVDQIGFDPTVASEGLSDSDSADRRAAYQRALTACLESRNYSVE